MQAPTTMSLHGGSTEPPESSTGNANISSCEFRLVLSTRVEGTRTYLRQRITCWGKEGECCGGGCLSVNILDIASQNPGFSQ